MTGVASGPYLFNVGAGQRSLFMGITGNPAHLKMKAVSGLGVFVISALLLHQRFF